MTHMIEMKHVSWRRDKKTILENINWEVLKGQHWAVLGLNGSGKTTLLNMVNGYIWPTTGEVHVLGQAFGRTDIRELRKSIGWVSSSLESRINGRQMTEDIVVSGKYAATVLYEAATPSDYETAFEIMDMLGCRYLSGRTYDTCSSGEKQKLLIARGLMAKPKLLILDEPSSGLDFVAREDLLKMIEQLVNQADAPTIILITHHIEEVLPIFTHALLLRDGQVFDQGKREDIFTNTGLTKFFDTPVHIEWRSERAWMSLMDK